MRALATLCLALTLLTAAAARGDTATDPGRIYVPVYSSVRVLDGRAQSLAVTIAIHNTHGSATLTIEAARLVGNDGSALGDLVAAPQPLRPFETLELFLRNTDFRDATGAGLVIDWSGAGPAPVAEAVMVGTSGTMGFAFTSRGVAVPR